MHISEHNDVYIYIYMLRVYGLVYAEAHAAALKTLPPKVTNSP